MSQKSGSLKLPKFNDPVVTDQRKISVGRKVSIARKVTIVNGDQQEESRDVDDMKQQKDVGAKIQFMGGGGDEEDEYENHLQDKNLNQKQLQELATFTKEEIDPQIAKDIQDKIRSRLQTILSVNSQKGAAVQEAQMFVQRGKTDQLDYVDLSDLNLYTIEWLDDYKWILLRQIILNNTSIKSILPLDNYRNLKFIYASGNRISQVTLTSHKLRVLDLSNNNIRSFPVLKNAIELLELNLSHNEIPSLSFIEEEEAISCINHLRKLKILDFSHNKIVFTKQTWDVLVEDLREYVTSLKSVCFNDNPFLDKDKLWISSNENVYNRLFALLQYCEKINGADPEMIQKEIEASLKANEIQEEEDDEEEEQMSDDENKKQKVKKADTKQVFNVTAGLADLILCLEKANEDPNDALVHMKTLAQFVKEIIEKKDYENLFAKGKSIPEVRELSDTFIQNCLLTMDNNQDLAEIILSLLAYLARISYCKFGNKCFRALNDLMQSGEEMEALVIDILTEEVIPEMNLDDVTQVEISLLEGLYELVEETENNDLLTPLFNSSFQNWLPNYSELLTKVSEEGKTLGNHPHYDAVIKLASVSVQDNDTNIQKMVDLGLIDEISCIISFSNWEHDRYIPCLVLIGELSNNNDKAATLFMEEKIYVNLLKLVNESITQYKINRTLLADPNVAVEDKLKKYETLAAEITTLGGLLQSDDDNRGIILREPVVIDLMNIIGNEETDPVLLTGILTFALDLFECDEIKNNEENMWRYAKGIKNLIYVTPLLGLDKFDRLVEMTSEYHLRGETPEIEELSEEEEEDEDEEDQDFQDFMTTQKSKTSGGGSKSKMMSNSDQKELDDIFGETQGQKAGIKKKEVMSKKQLTTLKLKNIDDTLVNDLVISAVNLIKLFCLEAAQNENNDLFDEISASLNSHNREDALFQCLNIQDDKVKLSVVQCFFVIPLDEFELLEVQNIVAIIGDCNNIDAGETEYVLSCIYWTINKMVLPEYQQIECCKIFQQKFGEKTINLALDTLLKNCGRITEDNDEDEQKYTLSLSILNFLKSSSLMQMMYPYLQNKGSIFKKILYQQDVASSSRVRTIPIDIENTQIGRDIINVLEAFSGNEAIEPYSDVSCRLMMRVADILMNRHDCPILEITIKMNVQKEMVKYQTKYYVEKKKSELKFWIDPPQSFIEDLEEGVKKEHEKQHQSFITWDAVQVVLVYLTKKYSYNEEWIKLLCDDVFEETVPEKKSDAKKSFAQDIFSKNETLEEEFKKKYMNFEEKPYCIRKNFWDKKMELESKKPKGLGQVPTDDEIKEMDDDEKEVAIFTHKEHCYETEMYDFDKNMKFEEYGQNFEAENDEGDEQEENDGPSKADVEYSLNVKYKQELAKQEGKMGADNSKKLKQARSDGFLNLELRSLTIAAFLRCLYASIEFSPNYELRQRVIQQIKVPEMFRLITQLCDTTSWDETANIGAKYLRLMRYIIKLPSERNSESTEMLMHYEILAIVIGKSLKTIQTKQQKDLQLTDGDKVAIYEISLLFFIVASQCNNFVFSHLDIVQVHVQQEIDLAYLNLNLNPLHNTPGPEGILEPESINGPWEKKCEIDVFQYGELADEGECANNYQFDIDELRKKRTIQNKMVEMMVTKMFSKESVYSLISMLFRDMTEDHKIFDAIPEEDEDAPVEEKKEVAKDEEVPDPAFYGRNLEEYLGVKSVLTIERIKDIVGVIMGSCQKKMKYNIIETMMKGVIFENMCLRDSFMQEILDSAEQCEYKIALQTYLKINKISIEKPPDGELMDWNERYLRIIEFFKVDLNLTIISDDDSVDFIKECDEQVKDQYAPQFDMHFICRLFVMTNEGILIMREPAPEDKCQKCPPATFCSRGPYVKMKIKYEELVTVVNFPNMPQKVVIFIQKNYRNGSTKKMQISLNIDTYTKSAKIIKCLNEIMYRIDAKRQAKIRQNTALGIPIEVGSGFTLKIHYSDFYVQYQLRKLVQRLDKAVSGNEECQIDKNKINKLKLTFVSLLPGTNILTPSAFAKKVSRPPLVSQSVGEEPADGGFFGGAMGGAMEEENDVPNSVALIIIGTYLIILKQNWSQWKFFTNRDDLIDYKKMIVFEKEQQDDKLKQLGQFQEDAAPPECPKAKDHIEYVDEMDKFCSFYSAKVGHNQLFNVIVMVDVEKDIENLIVHKGFAPSIDIQCKPEKDPKDKTKMVTLDISIQFGGDMERQQFCNDLNDLKVGDGDAEEAEEAQADEEELDSDNEEQFYDSASSEAENEATVYD